MLSWDKMIDRRNAEAAEENRSLPARQGMIGPSLYRKVERTTGLRFIVRYVTLVLPLTAGSAMCEKCKEIDAKIARYRQMAADVNDRAVLTLLGAFVADLEAEKSALHRSDN